MVEAWVGYIEPGGWPKNGKRDSGAAWLGLCEDPAPKTHSLSRTCAKKPLRPYALRDISGWPWGG